MVRVVRNKPSLRQRADRRYATRQRALDRRTYFDFLNKPHQLRFRHGLVDGDSTFGAYVAEQNYKAHGHLNEIKPQRSRGRRGIGLLLRNHTPGQLVSALRAYSKVNQARKLAHSGSKWKTVVLRDLHNEAAQRYQKLKRLKVGEDLQPSVDNLLKHLYQYYHIFDELIFFGCMENL
jgi:hypothetical protein